MDLLNKKAEYGAWISIGVYIVLSLLKIGAGWWGNSEALLADGLNNTSDIFASLAVLIGLRISNKPADADHQYGHSRAETIASMVASFVMFGAGIEVFRSAFAKIMEKEIALPDMFAAWVAVFSAVVMYLVYRYNSRLAQRTQSHALKAAALDNRSDAFVSLGTFIGVIGAINGLPWLDAATAIIVGLVIWKTAWDIFREATHMLTDGFDENELEKYKETVLSLNGVEGVKDIKGRVHGNQIFVDVVIEVDHEMNVLESHEITEHVESELLEKHQVMQVHVHIEPYMQNERLSK
ncbi:cation diffusion facilitator family transporter [Paenibacillus albus]|uniref:Cation transporter n=1 Tax=Paenibacillus albus TaxID=2495582 RepID=A0A3Q8X5M8_9BACL|nr:cation diffusion facilitator family transporter [Paenibacillus albus]AZN41084.1 cation transporter [Paenibacillus albus]